MDTTDNFKACWSYWRGMPTATIRQFVKLSYGLDPHRDPLHEVGGERQWSMLAAVRYAYVRSLGQEPSHDPELPGKELHPVDQVIDIREATTWAVEKGWDIPDQLRETFLTGHARSPAPSSNTDWGLLTLEQKKGAWNSMTPEGRRQKAPELVRVHRGNKTKAANEVGISANAFATLSRK